MLILIISLIYSVSALGASSSPKPTPPVYSRIYLRGMQRLENERIQSKYINIGITIIENSVFTAAKQGLLKFTTQPFDGCEAYSREKTNRISEDNEYSLGGIDKTVCENIVNGIHTLVSERFPDSTIVYDPVTKRYTLSWD